MKITESIEPKGQLTLQMWDAQGALVNERTHNNSILLTGRDLVAKRFAMPNLIDPISHVAVGTGTDATVPTVTEELTAEVFRKQVNNFVPAQHITTTGDDKKKVTFSCDLDFSEANAVLTEAGLFNAASNGTMYNRVVFPPVTKTNAFKLTLIWEITF
jgi:YD repeat-containing protein